MLVSRVLSPTLPPSVIQRSYNPTILQCSSYPLNPAECPEVDPGPWPGHWTLWAESRDTA